MMSDSKIPIPFWLIIPAAGQGRRIGGELPKQYQLLEGVNGFQPVLQHSLDAFLSIPNLFGVIVALPEGDTEFEKLSAANHPLVERVIGGDERADSVKNALDFLSQKKLTQKNTKNDWVLVHDAARPCVQTEDIVAMLVQLSESDVGGIMAVPVSDTLKVVRPNNKVDNTQSREHLWQAQTPQMFRLSLLQEALQKGLAKKSNGITDEASAIEKLGYAPEIFLGKRSNIKVTYPEDWVIAEAILKDKRIKEKDMNGVSAPQKLPFRVGHGYDVHRFAEPSDNAQIVLGGVNIPHTKNLLAHSDGDVLIHALCDALLGAVALGDIGKHFPDTDDTYKNMDSRILLKKVFDLLTEKKYQIANVDITVVAQAPKLSDYTQNMCENLAEDLQTTIEHINVKATTTENLGFEGREEGISCHAIVMLHAKTNG